MARVYEVRVRGELSPDLVRDLEAMGAVVGPAETLLVGDVRDQPALYGLLLRLQNHGLEVVEVQARGVPVSAPGAPGEPTGPSVEPPGPPGED